MPRESFKPSYTTIGTASSPKALRVAEETAIRQYSAAPGVSLSNKRHEMSASSFSSALGANAGAGISSGDHRRKRGRRQFFGGCRTALDQGSPCFACSNIRERLKWWGVG